MTVPPEPVPVPDGVARYVSGEYATAGMTAHHLREFVRLLDASGVPDDAAVYVYGRMNRDVSMVVLRVDLDSDDEDVLGQINDMLS